MADYQALNEEDSSPRTLSSNTSTPRSLGDVVRDRRRRSPRPNAPRRRADTESKDLKPAANCTEAEARVASKAEQVHAVRAELEAELSLETVSNPTSPRTDDEVYDMRTVSLQQRRRRELKAAGLSMPGESEEEEEVQSESFESSEQEEEPDMSAEGPDIKLISAAMKGDMTAVKSALLDGARLQAVEPNGRTALHAACAGLVETEDARRAVVKYLLTIGADASAADGFGKLPLELAAERRELASMHLLLSAFCELSTSVSGKVKEVCNYCEQKARESNEDENEDLTELVKRVRRILSS